VFCCSKPGIRWWSAQGEGEKQLRGDDRRREEKGREGWGRKERTDERRTKEEDEDETWRTVDELHRAGHQPDPFNEQSAAPNTSHLITHTYIPPLSHTHTLSGTLFLPSLLCSIPPSSTKYSLQIKQAAHSNRHTDEPFLSPSSLLSLSHSHHKPCLLSPAVTSCSSSPPIPLFLPFPSLRLMFPTLTARNTSVITQQTHYTDTALAGPIKTHYLQTAFGLEWAWCTHRNVYTDTRTYTHAHRHPHTYTCACKEQLWVIRSRLAAVVYCSLEQHVPAPSHCIQAEVLEIHCGCAFLWVLMMPVKTGTAY